VWPIISIENASAIQSPERCSDNQNPKLSRNSWNAFAFCSVPPTNR
jgi:hypothetical protein